MNTQSTAHYKAANAHNEYLSHLSAALEGYVNDEELARTFKMAVDASSTLKVSLLSLLDGRLNMYQRTLHMAVVHYHRFEACMITVRAQQSATGY